MVIHISTTLTLGKSLAIRREKDGDDEVTCAHLKFTDLFLSREQVNALCGQRPGWCETSFFDELGAPVGDWSLTLHKTAFVLAGAIDEPGGEGIRFTEAAVDSLELTFTKLGAVARGQVVWKVAGDEAGDIETLLGQQCRADWHLTDGGQQDMLWDRDMARRSASGRGREACA